MRTRMHLPSGHQLIEDIVVPKETAVNRRGHAMKQPQEVEAYPFTQHHCYIHNDGSLSRGMTGLALFSTIPGMLHAVRSALPRWSPKKYTVEDGLHTNWAGVIPSKSLVASTGILTAFLVAAALAVWMLPSKNPPAVIATQPHVPTRGIFGEETSAPMHDSSAQSPAQSDTNAAAGQTTASSSSWIIKPKNTSTAVSNSPITAGQGGSGSGNTSADSPADNPAPTVPADIPTPPEDTPDPGTGIPTVPVDPPLIPDNPLPIPEVTIDLNSL